MTISALGACAVYFGLGSTGPFSLQDDGGNPILFETNSEIVVQVTDLTGEYDPAALTLTLTVDYLLMGAGLGTPGAVTLTAPLPLGAMIVIRRHTPKTQSLDLIFGGDLSLENLEDTLDRITRITQELGEQTDRALMFSATETALIGSPSQIVPAPVAGRVLGWGTGGQLENVLQIGAQGPQGDPGVQGLRGRPVPGFAGDEGAEGVPGVPGKRGYRGWRGRSGPAIAGADGEDGAWGAPGKKCIGPRGRRGYMGFFGSDGEDGAWGAPAKRSSSTLIQIGTGAVARTPLDRYRDVIFAADFGVTANGSTDDTTAMQNAINAAIALGRRLYLPIGSIKTSAALTISAPICMIGCGHVMTVFKPTSTTANVFTIDCIEPVEFKDFGIDASAITMTAGAAIFVTHTSSNRNLESQFTGLRIVATFYGFLFDRAAYWTMHRCIVQACKNAHVYVRNLFEDDEGDSCISDCLLEFFDVPTSNNILLFHESSGGLKISGTKFLGGYHGYHLGLAAGAQTLGPIVTGNSFENQTAAAIFMGADNDATSFIARTVITGNEIASFGNGHGIQIGGSATSTWCRGVSISGNNITVDLDQAAASSAKGIVASFATDLAISGNVIKNDGAVGTTIGIELGSGVTRVSKALNIIQGFNTPLSDASTSPQFETFKGGVQTLDTFYAQGANPGFWLDETTGGTKGSYVVLDGGDVIIQRRATNFGAFEANLMTLNLASGLMTLTTGPIKTTAVAIASLPAAATAGSGARMMVNNHTGAVAFGTAPTAGGAINVPVYSTGAAWLMG